eukprot:SAG11_NODE_28462_length_321_cov_0.932432_1_plen_44_part_10
MFEEFRSLLSAVHKVVTSTHKYWHYTHYKLAHQGSHPVDASIHK